MGRQRQRDSKKRTKLASAMKQSRSKRTSIDITKDILTTLLDNVQEQKQSTKDCKAILNDILNLVESKIEECDPSSSQECTETWNVSPATPLSTAFDDNQWSVKYTDITNTNIEQDYEFFKDPVLMKKKKL